MNTPATTLATQNAVVSRRLRFRAAIAGLGQKAAEGDLVRGVIMPGAVALVLGLGFIFMGWYGAAHTARQIEQLPYLISGGVLGVALVLVGALMLVGALIAHVTKLASADADLRVARHIEALEAKMDAQVAVLTELVRAQQAAASNGTTTTRRRTTSTTRSSS